MPTVDSLLAQLWQQHQNGNVKGAEAGYRELLKKVPQNANAHVYLGIALFDLRRFAEAVDCYRAALKIQPLFPVAWNNLGNALRMLNQIDAADAAFQKALDQRPNYANAFKNRGTLWVWTGEIERGLKWYQDALKIAPEDVELHRNLGVIYLLQGRFDEGWQEYRWRWRMPHTPRPAIQCPLWEGQSLANKSIFVYPEQGLGDAIQFVRMIDVLRQQGARVTLGCEPRLVPLFSSLANVENIVPLGGQFQPVDYHASLVDVTDYTWQGAHSISGEPYLNVPANLIEFWRKQLGVIPGRRIGLCWQGNPSHHADVYRSIPLQAFRSLADVPGITFISLQHGQGSEQIQQCDFGHRIVRLPPNLDANGAFLDTAAIMKNLDCVITIDSSAGHLAGALGVETHLLLGKVPDWRWGLSGNRTPWYNHHRIWRQETVGDWQQPMSQLGQALRLNP